MTVLRTVTAVVAGVAVVVIVMDGISARRGHGRLVRRLLDRLSADPRADSTVESRVRRKLMRIARFPEAIAVSVEHGCVELRGAVTTEERARVVRALAAVKGVDSIVDLLTEPAAGAIPIRARAARPLGRAAHWAAALLGFLLVGEVRKRWLAQAGSE